MDPEKVGKFIKKLRKDNNLTQADLASKYGVTYQAVSKWENGINLPDVVLLRQMSKDFNISIESLLDGEEKQTVKERKIPYLTIGICIIIIILIISFFIFNSINNKETFDFKTISATCQEFEVSGSIAYDKEKSSIYISHINYCGGEDNKIYDNIKCSLYEKHDKTITKISECKSNENIKLEDYLKEVELNIENYNQTCKKYTDNSLYLEIEAESNNKTTTYKIPLKLNDNCAK